MSAQQIKGIGTLMLVVFGILLLSVIYCGFATVFPSTFPGAGACNVIMP
jgi:hypothetical protein